jgi:elongation factor P
MASTSDIKNGLCIEHNNDIMVVVEFQHVKPGKGAAFVRTKLKSLTSGRVLDNTFPSGHKIDIVRVERRKYQYLYKDEAGFNFMDNETFDQITVDDAVINAPEFLKEGCEVDIVFHADKNVPLTADLPAHMVFEVTYTEPGIKGDTANASLKPAKIETGATVKVPLFVNTGDLIRVDTRTKEYIERAK